MVEIDSEKEEEKEEKKTRNLKVEILTNGLRSKIIARLLMTVDDMSIPDTL